MQLSHVFFEIEVSAKALAANLTGERLLVVVSVHVESQIVDLVKRLVTNVALVRLLAAVCELVILVIALLMKTLATELADKRLKISMYARVSVKSRTTIEGLATRHAFVRFFGGVDDFVSAKCARLTETLAANFTDEWPGARVHWHVSSQIIMRIEHFAALRASESLLLVRSAKLASRRRALFTALIFWQHTGQIQSRGGLLNSRRRW